MSALWKFYFKKLTIPLYLPRIIAWSMSMFSECINVCCLVTRTKGVPF